MKPDRSHLLRKLLAGVCTAVLGACTMMGQSDTPALVGDPLPAHPEKGPFLFCYFLGNGDGLHLSASMDGRNFTAIGGKDKLFLKPTVGENLDGSARDSHLLRDPCIRQGPDGVYHLVWTSGWYQHGFGTASSTDLVHWSEQQFVQVWGKDSQAVNTWAPELFYDEKSKEWLIFWATTIAGAFPETLPKGRELAQADKGGPKNDVPLNHRLYYVTTKDFKTYSETKLLYDPGFNCIDATMARLPNGKYFMVLKDETKVPVAKKNLRTALADTPEGPWGKASEPISIDWVEGPTIARVGDWWYIYYDEYTRHTYGAIRSRDFEHWEQVKEDFSVPAGSRHGTVFPVSEGAFERVKGVGGDRG